MGLASIVILRFVVYFGLVFALLPIGQAIVFFILHNMLFGWYLASTFAPNHKGMPVIEDDVKIDFMLRQILTARNVRSHPIIDFWYGGLNYQIEHHLFPGVPRRSLRKVQAIVKTYCSEYNIPYHETGLLRSYYEIAQHLHEVSAVLRQPQPSQS